MDTRYPIYGILPLISLKEIIMPEKRTRPEREMDPKVEEAREHLKSARENMAKVAEAWIPVEVRENQRTARKEFLLGLRSLLDAAIDHTEKRSRP
jgi:hypothetical protein